MLCFCKILVLSEIILSDFFIGTVSGLYVHHETMTFYFFMESFRVVSFLDRCMRIVHNMTVLHVKVLRLTFVQFLI